MNSIKIPCHIHSKTREDSSWSFVYNSEEEISAIIKPERWSGEFRAEQPFIYQVERRIPQGLTENTTGHLLPGTSILGVTAVSHTVLTSLFMQSVWWNH